MNNRNLQPKTDSRELFDVVRRAVDGWADQAEFVPNTNIENSS